MASVQHFLTLADWDRAQCEALIELAARLKADPACARKLPGKTLALVFEKASTRTRLAFEVAMGALGGRCVFLSAADSQLGRGEPVADTARVLSRMVDCVAIRCFSHQTLELFSQHAEVPVINALSDSYHPCQLLADMLTFRQYRGAIQGKTVAWVGDGNNVCQSYVNAARRFDFTLRIACPPGFEPEAALLAAAGPRVTVMADPAAAVAEAHLVVTDVWASMGQEDDRAARERAFAGYQVDRKLMSLAAADALFTHCLPAHRGEEVAAEVIDGPQSVVWDAAENRLHTQKALLAQLLGA